MKLLCIYLLITLSFLSACQPSGLKTSKQILQEKAETVKKRKNTYAKLNRKIKEKKALQGKSWSDIPNFKELCGKLGYSFKLRVQSSPQFSGLKVYRSECEVRSDNRIAGYVYEFKNISNSRSWIQLEKGSTVAIDEESLNNLIDEIVNDKNQ